MSDIKDPFIYAKEMFSAGKNRIKITVDKLFEKKLKHDKYIEELKSGADECLSLLNDRRYTFYAKFLTEMRNNLSKTLERMAASGNNGIDMARVGAKIELFDELMNKPRQVIKDWEQTQKAISK